MTKHTPGPWKFSETQDYTIESPQSVPIAEYHVSSATEAEDLANARLIAAAPDMLETLHKIEAYLGDTSEDSHERVAQYLERVLVLTRHAIAKAESK